MIFEPDNTIEGADWIKQGVWDLPNYGTPEFFDAIGGEGNLESFKQTPTYKAAIANGLIHDDEWVADYTAPLGEEE